MSRYAIDAEDLLLVAAHRASNFDETNPEKTLILAEAQVLATLALAEQQRIANLIAYVAICEKRGAADAAYHLLDHSAREGLGLK